MAIIKAGYRLTVTSWENDADNYATKVIDGLTFERARICAAYCELFNSDDAVRNAYEPDDDEIATIDERVASVARADAGFIAHVFDAIGEDATDEQIRDYVFETIISEMGLCWRSDFYTRVCDSWRIEYVEQDINIPDVTDKFK